MSGPNQQIWFQPWNIPHLTSFHTSADLFSDWKEALFHAGEETKLSNF